MKFTGIGNCLAGLVVVGAPLGGSVGLAFADEQGNIIWKVPQGC